MGGIVVVGSLNMDLVVRVSRWPEAGETLIGEDFDQVPGGKGANQAAAAAVAGGSVAMVGLVGDDPFGETLRTTLTELGVNVEAVSVRPATRTGVALIGVDASGENRIVVVSGANAALAPDDVERSAGSGTWDGAAVLLVQCEIPAQTVLSACRLARSRHMTVVLDPAPPIDLPSEIWPLVDICTPNQGEAAALTEQEVRDAEGARRAGQKLRDRGVGAALVKLGPDGVLVLDERGCVHVPGIYVDAVDTTAAGDVFAGALAVALAEGSDLVDAASFANRAGALSTTRRGAQTSLPAREEIDRLSSAGPSGGCRGRSTSSTV